MELCMLVFIFIFVGYRFSTSTLLVSYLKNVLMKIDK